MVFKYHPVSARSDFERNGYVRLKNILEEDFVSYLNEYYEGCSCGDIPDLEASRIMGKKRQFLFDFPSQECAAVFRDGMSALTGIDRNSFTVSERHLYIYDPATAAWPAPHKDRAASHISIGIPIASPPGSSACVFPDFQFGANTEEKAVYLGDSATSDLREVYRDEHAVMLNEAPGDIVAFFGSALFHSRVNAGGTAIVYVKVNGVGHDPLGENLFADGRG